MSKSTIYADYLFVLRCINNNDNKFNSDGLDHFNYLTLLIRNFWKKWSRYSEDDIIFPYWTDLQYTLRRKREETKQKQVT